MQAFFPGMPTAPSSKLSSASSTSSTTPTSSCHHPTTSDLECLFTVAAHVLAQAMMPLQPSYSTGLRPQLHQCPGCQVVAEPCHHAGYTCFSPMKHGHPFRPTRPCHAQDTPQLCLAVCSLLYSSDQWTKPLHNRPAHGQPAPAHCQRPFAHAHDCSSRP